MTFRNKNGQPLRLEIKKKLSSRSDRVKCVDIHPTEPWVLSALYNGHVFIWDFEVGFVQNFTWRKQAWRKFTWLKPA